MEILGSYDDLKARVTELAKDRANVILPYADYKAATFGVLHYKVPDGGFPGDPEEKATVVEALRASAPIIAFHRYGSPLSHSLSYLDTLAQLIAAHESAVASGTDIAPHYSEEDGGPLLTDYSGAQQGVSRSLTVSKAAVSAALQPERIRSASIFTGHDWRHVLGCGVRPKVSNTALEHLYEGFRG